MRSSRPRGIAGRRCGALAIALVTLNSAGIAWAQSAATGYALERFYPAPAGAGGLVMDDLAIQPGLGGALEITGGFEQYPLELSNADQRLAVVQNEALADVSAAVSWSFLRGYLDFPMPLHLAGQSGTFEGYAYKAPALTLATNPDSITDVRIGSDARVFGSPGEPLRLGVSAQLYVPSNSPVDTRANYVTDGTVRAMFRALVAGDLGKYRYAGQVGFHLRPLDVDSTPGGPHGSELLFGAAAGRAFDVGEPWRLILGPEIYGETALSPFFGEATTGVEGLMTVRLEGTGPGPQVRFKVGGGGGIDPNFGAPQWRALAAVELFSNRVP